jgi:hypothetical protein
MADNPVQRAVDILGGELETQIAVRVKYWTLRDWLKTGVVPTTRYAVALSEATGGAVSVKELAGLANGNGDDGGKPSRFPKGGRVITTTSSVVEAVPAVEPAAPALKLRDAA